MSELAELWDRVGAARVLDVRVPDRVRIAIRSWASGADQLARNSGAIRPESVAAPSSWQTDGASDETLATIRRWEAWYTPAANAAKLPPLSLWNVSGNTEARETWPTLVSRANTINAPSYVKAYLTAEGGRWSGFLADTAELPSLLSRITDTTRSLDRQFRAWWSRRLNDTTWPRVSDNPAPQRQRRTRRRSVGLGSFAKLAVPAAVGALAAVLVLGRRKR